MKEARDTLTEMLVLIDHECAEMTAIIRSDPSVDKRGLANEGLVSLANSKRELLAAIYRFDVWQAQQANCRCCSVAA